MPLLSSSVEALRAARSCLHAIHCAASSPPPPSCQAMLLPRAAHQALHPSRSLCRAASSPTRLTPRSLRSTRASLSTMDVPLEDRHMLPLSIAIGALVYLVVFVLKWFTPKAACTRVPATAAAPLPSVVLELPSGARAVVSEFGACVTSYVPARGRSDVLFVSSAAVLDGSKAIRGGIPVVFPQFGQPDARMPSHGFARTSTWHVEAATTDPDNQYASAVFTLESSPETLAMWDHAFALVYTVTLRDHSLTVMLEVANKGKAPMPFQALLHNYFRVAATSQVGLRTPPSMRQYTDSLKAGAAGALKAGELATVADRETDIIFETPAARGEPLDAQLTTGGGHNVSLSVQAVATQETLAVEADLPLKLVFWNPWVAKAKRLTDLGDDDYKRFCCAEPLLECPADVVPAGTVVTVGQVIQAQALGGR